MCHVIRGWFTGWNICWSAESTQSLQTVSLARNWLSGTTDSISGSNSLQTLLISGNQLECDAVRLDNATLLGQGVFMDPTSEVFTNLGKEAAASAPYFNSFTYMVPFGYNATVMAFAGNPFLTVGTSMLSSGSAGRLVAQDRIRRGRLELFSGT